MSLQVYRDTVGGDAR